MDPTPVGQPRIEKGIRIVQICNLTYCPTVTFVTIAAASLSAQRPLLAVVVRFVRTLQTTCSRGSGPPVDQRGQVFTPNQAWTAGILPYAGARFTASTDDLTARLHESALDRMGPPAVSDVALSVARIAATSGRPDQGRRPPAPRRRRVGVNCLSWASSDMSGGWLTRGTCRESLPRRASTSAVS